MNNPVQIILNTQNYVNTESKPAGGSNTDFFKGRDDEFVAHKEQLDYSLANILDSSSFENENLVYANVTLQEDGWAKSHRPVTKLFTEKNSINVVGGNNLGEMIVGLSSDNIQTLRQLISTAPDKNEWMVKDGKKVPRVTPLRSEVSVIDQIRLYDKSDKRKFSVNQAIDWLKDPQTGHSYYIETFLSVSNKSNLEVTSLKKLINDIKDIYPKIEIHILEEDWIKSMFLLVKFKKNELIDVEKHNVFLKVIDTSPIVRTIFLPPVLQATNENIDTPTKGNILYPDPNTDYPVVGIIDTGVSDKIGLNAWSVGCIDYLDKEQQDLSHGTFIAGLIAQSNYLNTLNELDENNCKFYDLDLYPTTGDFDDYYPMGFLDLLKQLEEYIPIAKAYGVRIFNLSLNLLTCVEDERYGIFSNMIDHISKKHDVIFVITAGNLNKYARPEWPNDENDALKMLAEYRHQGLDRIFQPSESVYSVCVGALDAADPSGRLNPSRYTRRGPGVSFGQKPDVVHIGGNIDFPHNLFSIAPNGNITQGCGTSYAAPLVAKTLANLNHATNNSCTNETLKALLIHHSNKPDWLKTERMEKVGNDLVGFGLPSNAASSLLTDNHQITLVFSGTISDKQKLYFDFSWPSSLVSQKGSVNGDINITLVYQPEINRLNGSEFILQTLDVWLRQQHITKKTGSTKFANILNKNSKTNSKLESERIKHGSKWWPIVNFRQTFKDEGNSSLFRLVLNPLARAGHAITTPIPFTLIMTISDPDENQDIFNEIRTQLNANGVHIDDIRSTIRSRLRN